MTIELGSVRRLLTEAHGLIESLDGKSLNETDAVTSQASGDARRERARKSQELQVLANRLELAAQLVRAEYWFARGKGDPLNPERS